MRSWLLLAAAGLSLAACSPSASEEDTASNASAAAPAAKPTSVATIHDLMEHMVAPSADTLWNATAVISDERGTRDLSPKTAEDWERLEGAAITLAESQTLLVARGRQILPDGEASAPGGTLDAAQMRKLIDAEQADWHAHAAAMQATSTKALRAIRAKDLKALDAVGGEIDAVCESCHQRFWYPPEAGAKAP